MKITFVFNDGFIGTLQNNDCAIVMRWWSIFANNEAAQNTKFNAAILENSKGEILREFALVEEAKFAA